MAKISKNFVVFYSPGTFVHEMSEKPIKEWNIEKAKALARGVKERHSATPFGFQFITRTRGEDDLDSHISKKSPFYYLGGRIETLEQVEARADPKESILLSNMKGNGWKKIIINDNSWRMTQPFDEKKDVLLDFKP